MMNKAYGFPKGFLVGDGGPIGFTGDNIPKTDCDPLKSVK